MSGNRNRIDHSEALDLIGYGLAKFAGTTKGKNEIANRISGSRTAFFKRLVSEGIASSTNAVSNRQDNFDPFFGTKKGYSKKTTLYGPRKERLDAIIGMLDIEQFITFIEAIIAAETNKPISDEMHCLIEKAKLSLSSDTKMPQGSSVDSLNLEGVQEKQEIFEEEDSQGDKTQHTAAQWMLKQLGLLTGCKVFIAKNDRNHLYNGEALGKGCIQELPKKGIDNSVHSILSLIDVVWIKDNRIKYAFEVECSTSIFSGLLRISDLAYSMPYDNIMGYIIAPKERTNQVKKQLRRPTFTNQYLENHKWRYMTIEDLAELYNRCEGFSKGSVTPDVLEKFAHLVEREDEE